MPVLSLKDPKVRIVALSVAILVLLAGVLPIALRKPTPEEQVRSALGDMIRKAEGLDPAPLAEDVADPLNLRIGRREWTISRAEFDAVVGEMMGRLGTFSVRPVAWEILIEPSGDRALVNIDYHWTLSPASDPLSRRSSRHLSPNAPPFRAVVRLAREGDRWLVYSCEADTF